MVITSVSMYVADYAYSYLHPGERKIQFILPGLEEFLHPYDPWTPTGQTFIIRKLSEHEQQPEKTDVGSVRR